MADGQEPANINWPEDMSEKDREELRDILSAYDGALAEFDEDHAVVFPSDAERSRLFFDFLKRWDKAWSKPGQCMHDGCTKTSIARSHAIPLSGSIRLIAEDGHVMTPRFGDNGVDLVRVGVREASTFPGFCEEHEARFASFEQKKEMTEPEHFRLQAFRTLCREIYTLRHHRQKTEAMLAEYRRLRAAFIVDRMKQADKAGSVKFGRVRFENDPMETALLKQLEGIELDLPQLEALCSGIVDEIENAADNIPTMVFEFDIQLDVCLSGFGALNYMDHGVRKRAVCFLAIIPEVGGTKLMIGAAAEHADALRLHLQDRSSPAILEVLESWMIHGSDHWFMKPSAWAAIPRARQQAICDRILEPRSLAEIAPFSVLDGARRRLVRSIEDQLATGAISPDEIGHAQEVLAHEKAKLDHLPPVAEAV